MALLILKLYWSRQTTIQMVVKNEYANWKSLAMKLSAVAFFFLSSGDKNSIKKVDFKVNWIIKLYKWANIWKSHSRWIF